MIAPPGNPVIRLDARLLDRVDLIGRSPTVPLVTSGLATAGVAAAAMTWIPGHIVACVGLAYLAHERFTEARRRKNSRDLLLALGDLEVALHVADGPVAAKSIADQLSPYTRDAPITRPEVLRGCEAWRMRAQAEGKGEATALRELEHALLVGGDVVHLKGDYLQVGRHQRLPGQRGARVRAARREPAAARRALGAGRDGPASSSPPPERAAAGEKDVEVLAKRIAEYESWSGHTAGR